MNFVRLILFVDIPGDVGSHGRVVEAFIALELVGAGGMLIILATAAFGPGVKRYSTWYSFGASWIFSCISYTLLFIAGQLYREQPDIGLCMVQGALIYAAPTLCVSNIIACKPSITDHTVSSAGQRARRFLLSFM
jgi:hypothetical protein